MVNPSTLSAEAGGHGTGEGNDVVACFLEPLVVEDAVERCIADLVCVILRDDAEASPSDAGSDLNLEPEVKHVVFRPDGLHALAFVSVIHQEFSLFCSSR